ncbi:MAG: ATP-binding protein [Synergistes sp.]|nr:ATP-binding protein [Synergistes sp.]
MFRCRDEELRKLNRRYDNGGFECIIIYGRRRVGKTALIGEFCRNKPTVFFSALLEATERDNLKALSAAICTCKDPRAADVPEYDSFDAAFREITRMAADQRLVFVIDEYPYLAKSSPSISSRLQHLIDHTWKESNLFLILCGSSMSFMENQVLGYQSPLYGRRTGQFKIEPLTYKETALFNPDSDNVTNALIYGVTGGIPHYINKLNVRGDFRGALLENFFDRSAYLFEEPANLLKQELREPAAYNSIIAAIAGGASRMNEIATKTAIESGPCSKYLAVLVNLGILKKETPMTEKPGKKTIYSITDPFFRFWYRFVPGNFTPIATGRMANIYDSAVNAYLSEYMGLIFERMCREFLLWYAPDLGFQLADAGQWWGSDPDAKKQVQIDLVGTTNVKNEYLIASCKFRNDAVGLEELALLKHYADVFAKGEKYHYCIFSKGGFTQTLKDAAVKENVMLVTLDDMYA